jgi:peptidoglycan/LPS O-acetylase OafA/YrhL
MSVFRFKRLLNYGLTSHRARKHGHSVDKKVLRSKGAADLASLFRGNRDRPRDCRLIHRRSDVIAFEWYLLFAGNIYFMVFGGLGNPMAPLWSISIEEQFYLIWPCAMRWLSKCALGMCAIFFIALANITLIVLSWRHAIDSAIWANTFVQFEMFAAGILLVLAKRRVARHNFGLGFALVLAGLVLWFAACLQLNAKQPVGGFAAIGVGPLMIAFGIIALGCAAILQGFCIIGPSHMPRWAAYLGKISYGLYVFHVLAIDFAEALFNPNRGLLYLCAYMSLAFLLTATSAIISYNFLESPFLRLKRRFEIVHTRPI